MKLNVPFYEQESENDCGATSLKMVLDYFKNVHQKKELINLVDSEESGTTWTLGIAKAAAKIGFEVEFYTICLGSNLSNYGLDFYKEKIESRDSSERKLERLKSESKKLGVKWKRNLLH